MEYCLGLRKEDILIGETCELECFLDLFQQDLVPFSNLVGGASDGSGSIQLRFPLVAVF